MSHGTHGKPSFPKGGWPSGDTVRDGIVMIGVMLAIVAPGCADTRTATEQAPRGKEPVTARATGAEATDGCDEATAEGEGSESIQSALGLDEGPSSATPMPPLDALTSQERARRVSQLHPSLNAYVAPSPYPSNQAKVGNEPAEAAVPPTEHELSAASDTVDGTVAWQELSRAIRSVESDGYQVGISVADMSGNQILSYNQDATMYPASAVKAPYVFAVWSSRASHSGILSYWAESILGWSDNDSYHAMREAYGDSPIRGLAEECDLDMSYYGGSAWSWSQWYYPRTSPLDMTRMWCHFVPYFLDMGDDGASELRQMVTEREVAPIRDALPLAATTYGKAGWFSEHGDYGATPAAVDAGIVLWPDGRAYVVTIMTDTEEDMGAVSVLAACVDRAHYAMTHPAEIPTCE